MMAQVRPQVIPMTPANNPEAEQSVIGAILVRPEVLPKVAEILAPSDFYREAHGRIYQTMLDLHGKNEAVDLVTVTAFLKDRGQLEGVGGPVFLAALSEQVGFAVNAEHYARIVLDKARVRRIREAAEEIAQAAAGRIENVSEFLEAAETRFLSATQGIKGNRLSQNAEAILELSEFLKKDPPQRQTYLEPWLKEASINMVTGWRGVGKSGFAMGLVSAISSGEPFGPWPIITPAPSLYFDAEMTQQDTTERFASLFT
jgi:replicative DNA helicase